MIIDAVHYTFYLNIYQYIIKIDNFDKLTYTVTFNIFFYNKITYKIYLFSIKNNKHYI
jgi:hypothetical protein